MKSDKKITKKFKETEKWRVKKSDDDLTRYGQEIHGVKADKVIYKICLVNAE